MLSCLLSSRLEYIAEVLGGKYRLYQQPELSSECDVYNLDEYSSVS